MIRVGDRIEWDSAAHTHTRQMNIPNTGRIEHILPKGFKHVDDSVESCEQKDAVMFTVKVDNDTARIGLSANCPDLKFPDEKESNDLDDWEDDLFEEPKRLSFWYSSKRMTVCVVTDADGIILETASITRKFVGQHANALARWMKKQGGFKWRKLNG